MAVKKSGILCWFQISKLVLLTKCIQNFVGEITVWGKHLFYFPNFRIPLPVQVQSFVRYWKSKNRLPLINRPELGVLSLEFYGRFHRGGIIQGVLLYTMTPWKTPRKSMGEWDYRTRIIPLLSSMKPGISESLVDYSRFKSSKVDCKSPLSPL
jgi:hypothetical protein